MGAELFHGVVKEPIFQGCTLVEVKAMGSIYDLQGVLFSIFFANQSSNDRCIWGMAVNDIIFALFHDLF